MEKGPSAASDSATSRSSKFPSYKDLYPEFIPLPTNKCDS